jgi:hypothetical protein
VAVGQAVEAKELLDPARVLNTGGLGDVSQLTGAVKSFELLHGGEVGHLASGCRSPKPLPQGCEHRIFRNQASADVPGYRESKVIPPQRTGSSMESLATLDLRAFVPSRDFEVSKSFYETLGFTKTWEGNGMAEFQVGGHRFFLQNYYHEGWAKNCMLNLVVQDVSAWWSHIRAAGLVEKFPGAKASEPQPHAAGVMLYLHDPSGVLWHIQQRPAPAE